MTPVGEDAYLDGQRWQCNEHGSAMNTDEHGSAQCNSSMWSKHGQTWQCNEHGSETTRTTTQGQKKKKKISNCMRNESVRFTKLLKKQTGVLLSFNVKCWVHLASPEYKQQCYLIWIGPIQFVKPKNVSIVNLFIVSYQTCI